MTLSTIVELVVARGVYERLSTQYQKIKVRTDVKEARLLREIGRNPTLVHIRDGVGQAKAGIPLLIESVPRVNQDRGTFKRVGEICAETWISVQGFCGGRKGTDCGSS